MPLDLPEPRPDRLANSPLTLVVYQIRHEQTPSVAEVRTATEIHGTVRELLPILEESLVPDPSIALTIANSAFVAARGWRLRSVDGAWTTTVMPDALSLETAAYSDWAFFKSQVSLLLTALVETTHPQLQQRIGLRFINKIAHPSIKRASDWTGLINPEFLGPLSHGAIAGFVSGSQFAVEMDLDGEFSAILRYGAVKEREGGGRLIYLIDQDVFVRTARPFDPGAILDVTERLHTAILQLFQAALSTDLYAYLKGDSV